MINDINNRPLSLRTTGIAIRNIQLQQPFIISVKSNCKGEYSFFTVGPDGSDFDAVRPDGFAGPGMHQHDYFELLYVMEGELIQHIESGFYRYKKGDACLLNRNTRHFEESGEDYSVAFLHLSCKWVRDLFGDETNLESPRQIRGKCSEIYRFLLSNMDEEARFERDYLDFSATLSSAPHPGEKSEAAKQLDVLLEELKTKRIGFSYILKGLLLRFFNTLEDPTQFRISHIRLDSSAEDFLFARIRHLLEERHGRISRNELSSILNYNSSYLNRIVKKHTGQSILQFGQSFCLEEASRLLRETDERISDIYQKLGFLNRNNFYLFYKKHTGISPKEYRDLEKLKSGI